MDSNQSPRGGSRVAPSKVNRKRVALIAAAALIVVLAALAAWWCGFYGKIYPGTTVAGVDVGGMTVEQAADAFEQYLAASSGSISIVSGGETLAVLDTEQYRTSGSNHREKAETVAKETLAMTSSADVGWKLSSLFGTKHEYDSETDLAKQLYTGEFNGAAITREVGAVCAQRAVPAVDGGYSGTPVIQVTFGTDGLRYNVQQLSGEVQRRMTAGEFGDIFMEDYAVVVEAAQPDVDEIYAKYHTEAADAYYETNGEGVSELVPEVVGWSFDLDDAKAKLAAGENFAIRLVRTDPEVTADDLMKSMCQDLLAESMTTVENKANVDRTNNVRLAAEAINGTILMPGEEFSYNNTVGERTAERGYKKASVYVASGAEDQLGGGICQTSSTLYMAVLRARLEVTYRRPHAYTVGYTPLGEDATVYWGSLDFKFKNNRDYPIKIVAWQEGYDITCQIWGTDVDGYRVEISNERHYYNAYETIQVENPNLEYGKTRQKVQGHPGVSVTTYATVYDKDGNQVDYYKVADSRYTKLNRVLEVGTKGAPVEEPSTEPTTAPPSAEQTPTPPPATGNTTPTEPTTPPPSEGTQTTSTEQTTTSPAEQDQPAAPVDTQTPPVDNSAGNNASDNEPELVPAVPEP